MHPKGKISKATCLSLYQAAVQHPEAEAAFLERAYMHYFCDTRPTLLREDFAGTCAISTAWVMLDEDNRALAVEIDEPTAVWADKQICHSLGERTEDVIILLDDVMNISEPKVDIVASLNFSTLIYHTRQGMLTYLTHARQCLTDQGIVVLDLFGGKGATQIQQQSRRFTWHADHNHEIDAMYIWDQKCYDPSNQRIDCRIHFKLDDEREIENAFIYDWRLWSLQALQELILEAGFASSEVWCDTYDPESQQSDGHYQPATVYPTREDWVAYLVAIKR
ncbi:hypothetical protein [Poriferisphaera sp. WC338]|uniref:hypothetical protein n=1 Tax=Poriferisphaera sp. WC338 TaxID=3425129 RepID=UPI003D81B4FB